MTKIKIIARSIGCQLLIGFSVGIVQAVTLLMGLHHQTINWIGALMISLMGLPFNTGGFTVRFAFEAWVEPLESIVGHRSAVVFSNFPFYLILLLIQMAIVTLILSIRYQRVKTVKDWPIALILLLVLANSLANIMWPWWGS